MRLVLPDPGPDIELEIGPLELLPVDAELPERDFPTELGWPAWVEEAEGLVRVRFRFLDCTAVATARSARPGAGPALRALLARGRPDWSGEVAGLCDVLG